MDLKGMIPFTNKNSGILLYINPPRTTSTNKMDFYHASSF